MQKVGKLVEMEGNNKFQLVSQDQYESLLPDVF